MSELGTRLRELRVASGKSQRDLATEVGVGFPHISKVEKGTESPSDELLLKLAAALNADPDELLALAHRVPADVSDAILEKDTLAISFMRKWKSGDITDATVQRLLDAEDDS